MANTTVYSNHQGPFHGNEVPVKNYQTSLRSKWSHTFSCILVRTGGTYPHHIFIIHFMYFFCNCPSRCWHELTQFVSKIFKCLHLFNVVYFHEFSTNFCIIWCYVPFTFLFESYDDITGKIIIGGFFNIQSKLIFIQSIWKMVRRVFQIFFVFFPSILYNPQASFKKSPASSVKIIFKLLSTIQFIQYYLYYDLKL